MSTTTAPHPALASFHLPSILASQHPSIPLHAKPLQHSLAAFQAAIDAYVQKGKHEIARRKDTHAARMKEDGERRREMEEGIEREKRREIDLIELLEKEKQETKEMESSIHLLKKQLESLTEQATALDAEASDMRARIAKLRRDKNRDRAMLEERALSMSPELERYERRLGFSVTGIKQDVLLFKFTHLDEQAPDRVFSFVLDVSQKDYSVPMSDPPLGALPALLEQLNATGECWPFVKRVRWAFLSELNESRA